MQNIFFISITKPQKDYPKIDSHYKWISIHGSINFEKLSTEWIKHKPLAIYTFGDGIDWKIFNKIFNVRKRWIHLTTLPDELDVNPVVFGNVLGQEFDKDHPLISVITPAYKSGDKIMRPFRSLQSQSYSNWEWIIWDDSPNDHQDCYDDLIRIQKKDLRIRIYRAPSHSGYIGEMKRLASSVAEGRYIVEVDHDDDFHCDLFQWIIDAHKTYPSCVFFYTDSAEIYEESLDSHSYGDNFGHGYAAHVNEWCDFFNKHVTTALTAPPNPRTITHLVGLPNHIRCWTSDFYNKIGKHNSQISVADDFELLLRTFCEAIDDNHLYWCHIRACGYYQYRNRDGNTTFNRNALIQHNVACIYNYYKHLKNLPNLHEKDTENNIPRWKTDVSFYKNNHFTYIPQELKVDKTIALFKPTKEEVEDKVIECLIDKNTKEFKICVIGELPKIKNSYNRYISWWNLEEKDDYDNCRRYVEKFMHYGENELILPVRETFPVKEIFDTPKLTIITPCSRPLNLYSLFASIKLDLVHEWIIVFDTKKINPKDVDPTSFIFEDKKIRLLDYSGLKGGHGNPQRNFGLKAVSDGLVYFLDDDNIIHPNFWKLLNEMKSDNFYTFDQQRDKNTILKGDKIQVKYIDTAMFVIPRELIGESKWELDHYDADGRFLSEIHNKNADKHIYINKIGCYYNYLLK